MKSVLVMAATYTELDQFKKENHLYSKTDYYKRADVGEYHFLSHKDPKLLDKLRGQEYHQVIFLGDEPDNYKKGLVYNRVIPE